MTDNEKKFQDAQCAEHAAWAKMVKAKVGTGKVVHWATKTAVTRLTTLCTVTNTHNVNKRPYVWEVDGSTAVTCKNCLAIQGG